MEDHKKNKYAVSILALVVIILVFSFRTMNIVDGLNDRLDCIEENLGLDTGRYDSLSGQIEELESRLQQQSNIIDDFTIDFGEVDAKTGMGKQTITVVPKDYNSNTKTTVRVGKYSAELKLKNGKYEGVIETPVNELYDSYIFSFDTDGQVKSEIKRLSDKQDAVYDWEDALCNNCLRGDFATDEDGNVAKFESAHLYISDSEKCNNEPVLYLTKDGEELYKKEMKYDRKKEYYYCDINQEIKTKSGKVACYAEYVGKSGLKYKYIFLKADCDDGLEEIDAGWVEIYDIYDRKIEFQNMEETQE